MTQNSIAILWLASSNRCNGNNKNLDSFFGVDNMRIGISDKIDILSVFNIHGVTHLINQDFQSAIKQFVQLSDKKILLLRAEYEWTYSDSYCNQLLNISRWILSQRRNIPFILHIGDTHHGNQPISRSMRYVEKFNPDIVTCNQIHHLHFFSRPTVLPNIPLTKIFSNQIIHNKRSKETKKPFIHFPARNNGIHLSRWSTFQSLKSNRSISGHICDRRYDSSDKWIKAMSEYGASIYHPLGSSIGLNNILPASSMGVKIFAHKITSYSGQALIYKYFNINSTYYDNVDHLLEIIIEHISYPISQDARIHSNCYRLLPTAKIFLNTFLPSKVDRRHEKLRRFAIECPQKTICIKIYEDIQNILEIFSTIHTIFLFSSGSDIADNYLELILLDLGINIIRKDDNDDLQAHPAQTTLMVTFNSKQAIKVFTECDTFLELCCHHANLDYIKTYAVKPHALKLLTYKLIEKE